MNILGKLFIIISCIISSSNADVFSLSNNILDNNIKEYEQYLQKYRIILRYNNNTSQKQELLGHILKHAKKLFAIPGNDILKQMETSIKNFCNYIESYLSKKHNINNNKSNRLQVMYKFLQTGIKLLNEFIKTNDDRYIYNLIIVCPDMIPCLAKEFNVIINIGSVLMKDYKNLKKVIWIINSCVESSDENTYLLSTIFTLAMNENMPLNQIINSKDVSNKQVCKYLDWQVSN